MVRHHQSSIKHMVLLCMALTPYGLLARAEAGTAFGAAETAAGKSPSAALGETIRGAFKPETYKQAVDSFAKMIDNAYNMNGLFGVDQQQLKDLGLPAEYLQAAQRMRNGFRQSLANATKGTLLENATLGNLTLPRLNESFAESIMRSSVPITLAQDGKPQMPLLQAVGIWLGQQLKQAFDGESQPGGKLEGLLGPATANGRKLMQLDETPLDAAAADEETLDAIAAAARDIERIRTYVSNLAVIATEVLEADEAVAGGDTDDDDDDDWKDVDEDDNKAPAGASHKRKLQQPFIPTPGLPNNPYSGYASAFRFIFSNVFDWFRARGLYGLVPIIADIRGFLGRYNWPSDVLQILAAPVENFINANFFPLPQSNDDFTALVRRFFSDYCTYEEVSSASQVLGSYTGPTFSIQLKPVSCPIYADRVTGRSYISFADCDPAQLVISTTPLTITEAYLTAATYAGAECKYTEVYGVDTNLNLGGGTQAFTFRRSAQGIDIVPTLIQINPDLRFFRWSADFSPLNPAFSFAPGAANENVGLGIQLTSANSINQEPDQPTTADPSITLEAKTLVDAPAGGRDDAK